MKDKQNDKYLISLGIEEIPIVPTVSTVPTPPIVTAPTTPTVPIVPTQPTSKPPITSKPFSAQITNL